jgi:hypothetical protein
VLGKFESGLMVLRRWGPDERRPHPQLRHSEDVEGSPSGGEVEAYCRPDWIAPSKSDATEC